MLKKTERAYCFHGSDNTYTSIIYYANTKGVCPNHLLLYYNQSGELVKYKQLIKKNNKWEIIIYNE